MGTAGGGSTAAPTTTPVLVGGARSAVVRTVAEHHRAVVGFLLGVFLLLLLYTTVLSQSQPRAAIGTLLQSSTTPAAARSGQNAGNRPTASPSSTTSNLTQDDEQRTKDLVNEASDRMEEELIRKEIDQADSKNRTITQPAGAQRKPLCDLSDPRFDICEVSGDARTIGANRTVLYVPPAGGELGGGEVEEWSIRDQSRKHLEYIGNVTVRSVRSASQAPACTSRHAAPAVVFAMNGLTSNPWHDFSDVLVPLFLTARAYNGEVHLLATDLQPWFAQKYRRMLRNLSRYDVVDLDRDAVVRCFPRVTVGLRSHRDLGIDPARAPRNYSLLDFRLYLREVYSLPPAGVDIPYKAAAATGEQPIKPRLMLINRGRTRRFVNFPEVVAAARDAGFEVVPVEPRRDAGVEELARAVDACDVLMGAHGAGLTNFFFLRTGAVMLQVVPWGHMEGSAMRFYGGPAREMRLRDVEYSVAAEESTLHEKYGREHPVISDPESIHRQGWQLGMRYYWIEQDIRLNVTRFAPTLHQVLRMLKE